MEAQTASSLDKLRHVVTDAPRVMVVDGSKLVRKVIADVLKRELPGARIVACEGLESARAELAAEPVDLVTTALVLPDGDGLALARMVREAAGQSYVPVIVVSGDVQSRLEARSLNDDVTDYFDKALGHQALAEFIRGYVQPQPVPGARVLYVEDSRVVAVATKRMLERQDLEVLHFTEGEGAPYWDGSWPYSNIGVLLAFAIGFVGCWLLRRGAVRRQESEGAASPSTGAAR